MTRYVTALQRAAVPTALVLVGVLLLGFRQSAYIPLSGGRSAAELLILGLVILWAAATLVGNHTLGAAWSITVCALLYLATTILSYWTTLGPQPFVIDEANVIALVQRDIILCLLLFTLASLLTSRSRLLWLLGGLIIGATLSSVIALLSSITGADVAAIITIPFSYDNAPELASGLAREGITRPRGAASHPLALAVILMVIFPLALTMVVYLYRRHRSWWFAAVCTALIGLTTVLTLSRSALVGLVLSSAVVLAAINRKYVIYLFGGIGLAVMIGVLSSSGIARSLISIFLQIGSDPSISSRQKGAAEALDLILNAPLLGIGLGGYDAQEGHVLDNQYLGRWVETGTLGLLPFIALFLVAAAVALNSAHQLRHTDPDCSLLATAIAAAIIGLGLVTVIIDTAGFVQVWTTMWILFGAAAALPRLAAIAAATAPSRVRPAPREDSYVAPH